jgi:hypothetical protein
MDPLAARVRCLDIADSLCDEDCDASDILEIASTLWDWVMDPFKLEAVTEDDADNEDTATRQ